MIGLPDATGARRSPRWSPQRNPPGLEDLRAFARGRLAGYKTPRQLVVVQEIPRTASGKILKHRLRADLDSSG